MALNRPVSRRENARLEINVDQAAASIKTEIDTPNFGLIFAREIGADVHLLVIESLVGTLVALSNLLVATVLIVGFRTLMKRSFYVVVTNVIVFTSLKAFVELGFILPYYIMQSDGKYRKFGYFSTQYEFVIFNLSVFADFGVLFFSVLIAVNRLLAVTSKTGVSVAPRKPTFFSCLFVWACSTIIPLLFYLCKCQYVYSAEMKLYYNKCETHINLSLILTWVMYCLLYLSYVCVIIVLVLYVIIVILLRRMIQQNVSIGRNSSQRNVDINLLKQSLAVFSFYATSIISVFALTFVPYKFISPHYVSYIENLLNLSIAAIYPICILTMSGEMKSVLISKIGPSRSAIFAITTMNINANNANNS